MAIPRGVTSSNACSPYKAGDAVPHHSADDVQYAKSGTPPFFRQSPRRSRRIGIFKLLLRMQKHRDSEVCMAENRRSHLFRFLQATLSLE